MSKVEIPVFLADVRLGITEAKNIPNYNNSELSHYGVLLSLRLP